MTKFLQTSNEVASNLAIDRGENLLMIEFLESNDVSVTKFLDEAYSETEHVTEQHHGVVGSSETGEYEYEPDESDEHANTLMSNDQSVEKNAKKNGKKNKGKKSIGGPNEDVVFVEYLDSRHVEDFWLQ